MKTKKIHCNSCNQETNHKYIAESNKSYYEVEDDGHREHLVYQETTDYEFWSCLGCDTALLEEKFNCSGMCDYNGEDFYQYQYYPPRSNVLKREPKKFMHIDKNLKSTYEEIIQTSNLSLQIVSAMGIRALLEGICIKEGIDESKAYTLNGKIDKLKEESSIPEGIIQGLKSLKFIGDDAAHRLTTTSKHNISIAIDLLEALLINLYEAKFDLAQKAERVCKANVQNT